jgi:hypothetical protein
MSSEELEIRINDKGELSIKARGITGPTCVSEIEKILNGIAVPYSQEKTDDFYQKEKVKINKNTTVEVR